MRKMIGKTLYDTDTAEIVLRHAHGCFGDPDGYEESLYRTEKGSYFEYANGGPESIHPQESISRIAKKKVQGWLEAHQ